MKNWNFGGKNCFENGKFLKKNLGEKRGILDKKLRKKWEFFGNNSG